MSMNKQLIRKTILRKTISKDTEGIVYLSDIPKDCLPTDEINIIRDEGYYSENDSWNAQTILEIYRMIEETDDEYMARTTKEQKDKNWAKSRRYESYLKLKEEFENAH